MATFHDFTITSIDGKTINFADYKGKRILVVNVASKCGYTSQYAQLQELYEELNGKLVVVGFPCNDFGGQEPGEADEIHKFCTTTYGVTFPITEKITIKTDMHPIYKWLTTKAENGLMHGLVSWNFCKFLIDEEGQLVHALPSNVSPFDDRIMK